VSVFFTLTGWDGEGVKTLQETGTRHLMTRERVRQIRESVVKAIQDSGEDLAFLTKLFDGWSIPVGIEEAQRQLDSVNKGKGIPVDDYLHLVNLLTDDCPVVCIDIPKAGRVIVEKADVELVNDIASLVRSSKAAKLPSDYISEQLGLSHDKVKDIILACENSVLTDNKGQDIAVVVMRNKDERLISTIEKLSTIVPNVDLNTLEAANRRKCRGKVNKAMAPEAGIIKTMLSKYQGVEVKGNVVHFKYALPANKDTLSKIELTLIDLVKPGQVLTFAEIKSMLQDKGFADSTINWCVYSSPLLTGGQGKWQLVSSAA
jgi:hypothetical protein